MRAFAGPGAYSMNKPIPILSRVREARTHADDAVVLGEREDGSVRLWEPGHGEVTAQARASYVKQDPGSRAYASAGLPGAEWWVAGSAGGAPHSADVELDDVGALYTENDLWSAAFGAKT